MKSWFQKKQNEKVKGLDSGGSAQRKNKQAGCIVGSPSAT